jgi:hypothetical protein
MYCLIVLCIKACLGDKKRKNFLIHSTLLFHGKTKTKKVRMGIIHDETRRERKVVKSFVDIFSTAFFFIDLGQTCPKMICPVLLQDGQTYFQNTFFFKGWSPICFHACF